MIITVNHNTNVVEVQLGNTAVTLDELLEIVDYAEKCGLELPFQMRIFDSGRLIQDAVIGDSLTGYDVLRVVIKTAHTAYTLKQETRNA